MKKKAAVSFFDWDDLWVDPSRNNENKNFRGKWDYKIKGFFEKKIPATSANMTVCSKYLQKLAIARGAGDVAIIPNGCWEYEVPGKIASRKKLGLQEEAMYMGFMGRTNAELHWCFEALELCLQQNLPIRFALCGADKRELDNVPPHVLNHIDYLGNLTPLDTRYFAAAMDLGLLPLMKIDFNESRFPIKFAEYMAAGLPILCSEVGEIHEYGKNFPWVIKAGTDKAAWISAFVKTAKIVVEKKLPAVDRKTVMDIFSWPNISKQVEQVYLQKIKEKTVFSETAKSKM